MFERKERKENRTKLNRTGTQPFSESETLQFFASNERPKLLLINRMAPQRIPGGAAKFRASPAFQKLLYFIPNINQLLRNNGALIAGSSVLASLVEGGNAWEGIDIDMYVPIPNDKQVHTEIQQTLGEYYQIYVKSSSYCRSFMRRNGIRTVGTYRKEEERDGLPYNLAIDVMAVRKKTTPLQVVQNFDLTFCQVWYDGKDVWATHPQHIQTMTGYLQGDYVPVYLSGNKFLKSRIEKYVNRGFSVGADKQGKILTKEMLADFSLTPIRESCDIFYSHEIDESEIGIIWARKTMFRACFKYAHYTPANTYRREEEGYDSDEYVETPEKLVELAGGTREELSQHIDSYLRKIEKYFSATTCHMENDIMERFMDPLVTQINEICGDTYKMVTGNDPVINLCLNRNVEYNTNYNYNSGNSEENNEYYQTNEANVSKIPPIPAQYNRPVQTRPAYRAPEGQNAPTECYDPYMAMMTDIADNQVQFYIFNKPVGNAEPTLAGVACIDNETEDGGQTISLYKKFLEDITYLYYQCKPTVPAGSLFITRNDVHPQPLRRLALDRNIYVYESQVKKIQAGKKYALIPTETPVGRIASEALIQTGNAIGAEHCQTIYEDTIHEIFEMVAAQGGVRFKKLGRAKQNTRRFKRHAKRGTVKSYGRRKSRRYHRK